MATVAPISPLHVQKVLQDKAIDILESLDGMIECANTLSHNFMKPALTTKISTDDYNILVQSTINSISEFEKTYLITMDKYKSILNYYTLLFSKDLNDLYLNIKQNYDQKNAIFPNCTVLTMESEEWELFKITVGHDGSPAIVPVDKQLYTLNYIIEILMSDQPSYNNIIRDYIVKIELFITSFKDFTSDNVLNYINNIKNIVNYAFDPNLMIDNISGRLREDSEFLLSVSKKLKDYLFKLDRATTVVLNNYELYNKAGTLHSLADYTL